MATSPLTRSADVDVPAAQLTIAGVLQLVWARKALFAATVVLAAAALIAYAYLATPVYRVSAKLMPRQADNPAAGVQALLSQFGGLASLAGVSFGASVDEQEAIVWLKSRALAQRFLQQHDMLPILFADAWDPATKRWRADIAEPPSMDDAWSVFDRRVRRVNQDMKTKVVTLEMAWTDRTLAVKWANELARQANEELRQRALREADATLDSLNQQLADTDTVELRQSIYRLVEVQLNRKVLARSRADYAFTILDPAVVPDADRFTSPRRRLLVMVAVPLGIFAGCAVVLALHIAFTYLPALRSR